MISGALITSYPLISVKLMCCLVFQLLNSKTYIESTFNGFLNGYEYSFYIKINIEINEIGGMVGVVPQKTWVVIFCKVQK